MKTCTCCKIEYPIEKFAFKNKALDKRNSMCDDCRRERQKNSYYKHHQTNLNRIRRNKQSSLTWFKELKSTLSCCVCGENEPDCLDFHHIDGNDKEFILSKIKKGSIGRMIIEINKCACLCANCHRKHHAGKLNAPLVKLDIT
jgi:hypothetical protein